MNKLNLIYEQDLPEDITAETYTLWFQSSIISSGVRMGLPFSELTDNSEQNVKKVLTAIQQAQAEKIEEYNMSRKSPFQEYAITYNSMTMEPQNLIEYVEMQKQIQFAEIICFLGGQSHLHVTMAVYKMPAIVWCGAKVPQPVFDILATFCETQRIQPNFALGNIPEADNIICLQWSPEVPPIAQLHCANCGNTQIQEGMRCSCGSGIFQTPTQSEYKKDDMDNIIINGKLSIKRLYELAKQEGIEDRSLFFSVKNKVTGQSFGTHEIVDFGKGWTKNTAIMHLTWEDLPQQDAAQG